MTMTKSDLNSTTALLEIALNTIYENCKIKVRTGLIKERIKIRAIEQKTLGDFCEGFCEGGVVPYTDYYLTIHPSLLQVEEIENTWESLLVKISILIKEF